MNTFTRGLQIVLLALTACSQSADQSQENLLFQPTSGDAKPWTFWHWVHGAVSKDGLTADLEAMKAQGIGGAYIFAIRDTVGIYEQQVVTYSPEWWDLVKHATSEANRIGVELGFNSCDGFTTAGGPWISPELSMQKVVWADTIVEGGRNISLKLPKLEDYKGYAEDIAVYAFPISKKEQDSWLENPVVTTNMKEGDVQYLAKKNNTKTFSSKDEGWIQFSFEKLFTCKSVQIMTGWANYQSNRLLIQVSPNGKDFYDHMRLTAPRSGWQDLYQPCTQAIAPVTARYFRFVFSKDGSEPGAEDLDDAKWSPKLALNGIRLLSSSRITQFEGKNASIWRIAEETGDLIDSADYIAAAKIIDISTFCKEGKLNWQAPDGKWKIIRMGHTSTGRENYIGGGARGLECDKLNPDAVKLQFDKWFGEVYRQVGDSLAKQTITRLLCDSWECGSQNWSTNFAHEFQLRRGYDLLPFLPVMAGIPIENVETSERLLKDVRETVAELLAENFSGTMAQEAHKLGVLFVEESNAPTGVVDGMLHHKYVDYPAGEFWFQSPSHDKPNDVLDAVSAAHIYGKPVVQAESFTQIRLDWNETPAMLKPYADRNLALGINKIVNHVFVHNPWLDRKPGATLDKVGTFLQRDQTWWNMANGFFGYLERTQSFLQQGMPVVDIAVFTGEEIPRRAILPDRLVNTLPGLFGSERVEAEKIRLANDSFSKFEMPRTVSTMANMARPENWIDPLRGYHYDSFNKDALLNLANVEDGRIVLESGMSYALLVIPGNRIMNPHGGDRMSVPVALKIDSLLQEGATIVMQQIPTKTISFNESDEQLAEIMRIMCSGKRKTLDVEGEKLEYIKRGNGKLFIGTYNLESLRVLEIEPDFSSNQIGKIAWNHRKTDYEDFYFVANQSNDRLSAQMSFRTEEKPIIYDPVNNEYKFCSYTEKNDRIVIDYNFEPFESAIIIFGSNQKVKLQVHKNPSIELKKWDIEFLPDFACNANFKGVELFDWTTSSDEQIKYYSGEAIYSTTFHWEGANVAYLDLGKLCDVAEVKLNGEKLGVVWTAPYGLKMQNLQKGENNLQIIVANTWNNRLIGDHNLPKQKQTSWTTAPYRLEGQPLINAGLIGPIFVK